MFAVIFEVTPLPARETRYFEIAATLREHLEQMDGLCRWSDFKVSPGRAAICR